MGVSKLSSAQDKVRAAFLGVAIGDALGMPVETFSAERIAADYGRIDRYYEPKDHKWFKGEPAGMVTDDTQLTLAVAQAMISCVEQGINPLSMDAQAAHHVRSMKDEGTKGWGHSTRDSVRRLSNGVDWKSSGQAKGVGNGVPMKILPVGLYLAKIIDDDAKVNECLDFIGQLSAMTHQTSISASAGIVQAMAVYSCFVNTPKKLKIPSMVELLVKASDLGKTVFPDTITDDLTESIKLLAEHERFDKDAIIKQFGAGTCYCYHSVPFTLMFFVKNPTSIESLYDVISAGGDTDSNGSMLASLLGALNGTSVFPQSLIDELPDRDKVLAVADEFYSKVLC